MEESRRDIRHVVWLIGFIVLVAIAAVACAKASDGASNGPTSNVDGVVLLRGLQSEDPGAGLVVTARSPKAHTRLATTRTASDGSFHFQLKPGWYLLTVDYWGGLAAQVHVPAHGVASTTITGPSKDRGDTRAVTINDIPDVLPPHGLRVGAIVLLEPPPKRLPRSVMSMDEAIAGREFGKGTPTRAVLAVVTARGVRIGMKNPTKPLRDWLAWVIIRTHQRPSDARIGPYVPAGVSYTPILALNIVSMIDARTGEFLLGFFTK